MSRVPNKPTILNTSDPALRRLGHDLWQQLTQTINGQISLGGPNGNLGNTDNTHFEGNVPTASVDFIINHGLGRVPVGFIVSSKSAFTDVMKGVTPWTKQQLSIQVSVAPVELTLLIY